MLVLRQLPGRDSLLVLNHHRIGRSDDDPFDPDVFSATADELDEQVAYLKRHVSLVTLEEALAFIGGTIREKARRCRVLITFDDGYLDNHRLAFPILRSHGVQGVFFLATDLVGSCHVPWWDHAAYLMRTARRRQFTLRYPANLPVDIDANGIGKSLRDVLALYKNPQNTDRARFLDGLREGTRSEDPPGGQRRFLDWEEAKEMVAGGMAVGSHTHTHHVLSQLGTDRQRQELAQSRTLLHQWLGVRADTLAYPVGIPGSFSGQTERLAGEAGYRAAFSFGGGVNLPGRTRRYDVKRVAAGRHSRSRFRVQTEICRFAGSYWP